MPENEYMYERKEKSHLKFCKKIRRFPTTISRIKINFAFYTEFLQYPAYEIANRNLADSEYLFDKTHQRDLLIYKIYSSKNCFPYDKW